jgi:hypothetical protein
MKYGKRAVLRYLNACRFIINNLKQYGFENEYNCEDREIFDFCDSYYLKYSEIEREYYTKKRKYDGDLPSKITIVAKKENINIIKSYLPKEKLGFKISVII